LVTVDGLTFSLSLAAMKASTVQIAPQRSGGAGDETGTRDIQLGRLAL
jgi:hypothetical protein